MRIDKYIWCVRLCKTRTAASKECNSEKVKLNDDFVKSSKEVKLGDEIAVKRGPIWKRYEILNIPKSRVGAKLVSELIKETTPWEDLDILERVEMQNKQNRQVGIYGRPTKKTRREMDRFKKDLED
ncbi:MAG: RNA-binding S4 domain-containing protein [Flavobacteriales bacterium]|nr:RNA-binding S4 domain-containing protein [Flavobacteriales bacterium]